MVPTLTTEQRRDYLRRAMADRYERMCVRQELKAGEMTVERVFGLADGGMRSVANMRAKQMINAMPGYGLKRTQALMRELRIADNRRIKGLGPRQRAALIERFGGGAE